MTPPPPNVSSTSFLLYNPGTERAHTVFRIAGNVGNGMLIRNLTTGQRCKIVNPTDESLLPGAHLELDSRMGQTRIVLGDSRELAFAMGRASRISCRHEHARSNRQRRYGCNQRQGCAFQSRHFLCRIAPQQRNGRTDLSCAGMMR